MSDGDNVIDFSEAAMRMAGKSSPDLAKRKQEAAAATARRLGDAEGIASEMVEKKLSVGDRRLLVKNLGGIAVSIFGSETAAKSKIVEVFKTAFGRDWNSQYKKRGRFFRFPSEGEPGEGAGATYARGWAYLELARALAQLDSRADRADEFAEKRMILRMIEGTSLDSTARAKGRYRAKGEAAFRDVLRRLVRRVEPKLDRMLEAGLEAGKTVEDFSIDLGGMDAEEFLARNLPAVKIGTITQKMPVIHAVPLGITVEKLARRVADLLSDAGTRQAYINRVPSDAFALSLPDSDPVKVLMLGALARTNILIDIAAEALGGPASDQQADVSWLVDRVGRARLLDLFTLSEIRFEFETGFPAFLDLNDLSNAELLDKISNAPVATSNDDFPLNYNYAFMTVWRSLSLSPVLEKATNDWRLALSMSSLQDAVAAPDDVSPEQTNSWASQFGTVGLGVAACLRSGSFTQTELDGWGSHPIVIGWIARKDSGEVFLTFYDAFEQEGRRPGPLPGHGPGWTTVVQSSEGLSSCLAPLPQPASPMHRRLDLRLTAGTHHPLVPADSLAGAILADLSQSENGSDAGTILTELEAKIDAWATHFRRQAREKLDAYERGIRHLRVPET